MSFYKIAGGMVQPSTKEELRHEIRIRLNRGQTNLNDIDTSKITDMSNLFNKLDRNIDVSLWDVSNVTDMRCMFYECSYFNCDLSHWDVSKVKEMAGMFCGCTNFNCDLSGWNTKSLIFSSEIFFNSGMKEKPKWCC